jgi:hypothetical protein
MKKRDFNAALKAITVKGRIDLHKANALSDAQKAEITNYIVRNDLSRKVGLLVQLIPMSEEYITHLHSMGYLYRHTSPYSGYSFLCTSAGKLDLESIDAHLSLLGVPKISQPISKHPIPSLDFQLLLHILNS